jgi:hypothetical protein
MALRADGNDNYILIRKQNKILGFSFGNIDNLCVSHIKDATDL